MRAKDIEVGKIYRNRGKGRRSISTKYHLGTKKPYECQTVIIDNGISILTPKGFDETSRTFDHFPEHHKCLCCHLMRSLAMLDIEIKPLTTNISKVELIHKETGDAIYLGQLDFAQRRDLISDLAAIIQELCE